MSLVSTTKTKQTKQTKTTTKHPGVAALPLALAVPLALLVMGCPLFKSAEIEDRELKHRYAGIARELNSHAKDYPTLVSLIRKRWDKAKPACDAALKLDDEHARVDAMKAALKPVDDPLHRLSHFVRIYRSTESQLRSAEKQLSAAQQARFRQPAEAARKMLMAARPSDAELLPLLKKTSSELFDRYNTLLEVVGEGSK